MGFTRRPNAQTCYSRKLFRATTPSAICSQPSQPTRTPILVRLVRGKARLLQARGAETGDADAAGVGLVRFLEQVGEDGPRIGRVFRDLRDVGHRRTIAIAIGRRPIARYRYARIEEFALIRRIFGRDSRGDRFQTLEARRRLEMRALLAAMQSRSALRTIRPPIQIRRERGGAVITARGRYRLHHPRQTRTGYIDGWTWTLGTRALLAPGSASGKFAAGVLIAALPVLSFAFHTILVGSLLWVLIRTEP